ncbi:MAG: hypothetical protein QNJ94_18610 [Alphaproteobacteria bacterium]|nr:hypothetical protein [Alphaproteobacteria bacterium]
MTEEHIYTVDCGREDCGKPRFGSLRHFACCERCGARFEYLMPRLFIQKGPPERSRRTGHE